MPCICAGAVYRRHSNGAHKTSMSGDLESARRYNNILCCHVLSSLLFFFFCLYAFCLQKEDAHLLRQQVRGAFFIKVPPCKAQHGEASKARIREMEKRVEYWQAE